VTELVSDAPGYAELLASLKERVATARVRASLSVNRELVLLYWGIGRDILERQRAQGWGSAVVERLGSDMRIAFPEMKGLSGRNLKYMRAFAEAWPDLPIVQQLVAQLPWGHCVRLLDAKLGGNEQLWYVRAAIEHGWSRAVMLHQIDSGLYHRQGSAPTNFARTLPAPLSDLAQQIVKDPYSFEFLDIAAEVHERDLERALTERIRQTVLELGKGFAFVGSQYHLLVGGEDFYIDMLFYHLRLRCFVVIEPKTVDFKPEFAGKMNFYLSAVDDLLRHPADAPSIGIILCRGRNATVLEYSLRDTAKPMGVAGDRLADAPPPALLGDLPTIDKMIRELPIGQVEGGLG